MSSGDLLGFFFASRDFSLLGWVEKIFFKFVVAKFTYIFLE